MPTNAGLRVFDGGVAIVTGAASGIGRALAEELAARGCEVVVADVDVDLAEQAAASIRGRGGHATVAILDVANHEAVARTVRDTRERCGRLDFLFNNAGIGTAGEIRDHTIAAWRTIVDVNLMGVVHGVQAAYPVMIEQGFGHIVNTASMAGFSAGASGSYTATKHAVVGLSKMLRAEAHAFGVRASVLCPGVIRTPLLRGGKRGIFLEHSLPEDEQRELAATIFERLRPMDASRFARKALDGVARNKAIIIAPVGWRLFWFIDRLFPPFGMFAARKAAEMARRALEAKHRDDARSRPGQPPAAGPRTNP